MKKNVLYLLSVLIFLTSCRKEFSIDGSSISSQDYISFSMLNQNIVYSDTLKNNPDSLIALYYNGITDTSLSTSGNIKIYALAALAVRAKDSSMVSLLVEGLSPIKAAKYNFVDSAAINDSNGLAQPKFFGVSYAIGTTTGYAFIDETQTTGYVQINNINLADKIVEGTFVQNNCAKYDGNSNILFQGFNMTNGAFRFSKMIIINQSDYDKYKSYLH